MDGHGTTHRAESAPTPDKFRARRLADIMAKAQSAVTTQTLMYLIAEAYDLGAADATKES